MRIRTIKPEFWTSETIAPLSDKAKLLAIGLLNFADDEGYFWANPILIRAAIFPFLDESKTLLGLLQDLSRVGYIQLGKRSDDSRSVGRVTNFMIHQRIDKPKGSIIKENVQFLDESKTPPRHVPDASPLEGKGKEQGKEQGKPRPSLEEVKLCCSKAGLPESDAIWFWNKCEGNGWTNGGKPIKSWPHTIASWKAGGYLPSQKNNKPPLASRPTGGNI